MNDKHERKIKPWAVLFWLAVWQIAAMIIHQRIILVSPLEAARRLGQLIITADFWGSIVNSLLHIIEGFLSALLLGMLCASASSKWERFAQLMEPLIQAFKSIPVASFIILVLFYVSKQQVSVFISFLMVFPIIYENMLAGIRSCDPKLLEMAEVFELKKSTIIKTIYLSQLQPYLESACSLGAGLAWKSGIAAEVIGLPSHSIGDALYEAKIYLDTADVFAWTIAVAVLSVLFQKAFMALLRHIIRRMQKVL